MEKLIDFLFELNTWEGRTFPNQPLTGKLNHLKEEVDELIEAIGLTDNLSTSNTFLRHELADCFILLFAAAGKMGFGAKDVLAAMREKFEIIKQRDYNTPTDKNGIIKHRKPVKSVGVITPYAAHFSSYVKEFGMDGENYRHIYDGADLSGFEFDRIDEGPDPYAVSKGTRNEANGRLKVCIS